MTPETPCEELGRLREVVFFQLNNGSGGLLEAAVLVLLPVPAGDGALHAGALGENRLQYPFGGSECELTC